MSDKHQQQMDSFVKMNQQKKSMLFLRSIVFKHEFCEHKMAVFAGVLDQPSDW